MAAPIKTDIIYYCTDSDFELEFNLGGCCSMRLLSDRPKSKGEFLKSLGRAVSRSQIIFVLGALDGENPVIQDLSAAINYSVSPRDLSAFGIQKKVLLPERSIPLVTNDGVFGGCVVECGPQSIVILTDDRNLRRTIMRELVHDYVRDFDRNSRKTVKKTYRTQDVGSTSTDGQKVGGAYPYMLEETQVPEADFKKLEKEFEEKAESKPRTGLKRFFTFLFILLFLFIGVATYIKFVEPIVIDRIYNEYREMYGKANTLGSDEITDNLGKLYSFNSDTVGYLEVHGTGIAYPIVSDIEKAENYYQKHLYNGWYSYLYGTPYTVNDIKNTKYHRNILIFGKDTIDGTMFSSLADIKTLSGYHSSHTLRFDTLYNSGIYKIFAAFDCEKEDLDALLKTEFWDDGEFSEYVNLLRTRSSINTTVDVMGSDEIVTLITYGKEKSTVIVARRVRNGESSLVDTQGATENMGTPVIPEVSSSEARPAATVADENIPYKNFSTRYEQGKPLDSQSVLDYTSQYAKTSSDEETEPDNQSTDYAGEIINVTDADTGERVSGTVLDILCRVVEAEIGSGGESEAIKAQAVASYGWLMTNGAWDDGAPSVALKTASSKVITEVKTVIGLKPYINGQVAQTMYFPCSAGHTADGNKLFGAELGYGAKDSSFDRNCDEFVKYYTYSANDIKNWVYETTGIDLSAVSDKERWIHTAYDQNGAYVSYVWFGNNSTFYSGRFVRERLLSAERTHGKTLASTAFRVSYQPESDTFVFETRGVGHGVGMSQYGANELAKSGKTYVEILNHYFDGITVEY